MHKSEWYITLGDANRYTHIFNLFMDCMQTRVFDFRNFLNKPSGETWMIWYLQLSYFSCHLTEYHFNDFNWSQMRMHTVSISHFKCLTLIWCNQVVFMLMDNAQSFNYKACKNFRPLPKTMVLRTKLVRVRGSRWRKKKKSASLWKMHGFCWIHTNGTQIINSKFKTPVTTRLFHRIIYSSICWIATYIWNKISLKGKHRN